MSSLDPHTEIDPHTDIVTARLRLVPLDMRWRDDIFREFTGDITRYMYPAPAREVSETEAFIQRAIAQRKAGTDLILAILDGETGEFLGVVGAHGLHLETPELGIWLKQAAHRNGYGREAIGGVIDWVGANYPATSLRYPVDRDNGASRRIPESFHGELVSEYDQIAQWGGKLHLVEYLVPLGRTQEET